MQLRASSTVFLGHVLTKEGLKVDPNKIKAIEQMPKPVNVQGIQRFCGMINYLSRFLPKISRVLEPLRKLTVKDTPWQWGKPQEEAFQKAKDAVTRAPILAYFDSRKPLETQCDASDLGLGAALLQNGQPVSFASRALTPTEIRYAQIEKEMLTIVFALNKFHQYTVRRETKIISDHKPFQAILKKRLDQVPRRLQGMILQTQRYNIVIEHRPDKELLLADAMSRAFLPNESNQQELENVNVVHYLPVRKETLEKIRSATERDESLQRLKTIILSGWPQDKRKLPQDMCVYFTYRDELAVEDNLISKGLRLIVPMSLRGEIKATLHSSHLGIESCLRRARECVFWPGMNAEKDLIAGCEICQKHAHSQQRETLSPHPEPSYPWERVGCDIFEFKRKNFLITVDYYSNFWEVDQLN